MDPLLKEQETTTQKKSQEYSADSIQVLEGLEAVQFILMTSYSCQE